MRSLITKKRLAIFCYGAVMLACIPGLLKLEIEQDVSRSLQPITGDEVEILKFQRSNYPSDYGSKIYVLIPDQNIEQWALAFRSLHEDLEKLQSVYRVESLINARHVQKEIFPDGEVGVDMGDFLAPGQELNKDLLTDAKSYGSFQGTLIKQFLDGTYWAILIVVAKGPLKEDGELYSFDAVAFNKDVSGLIEEYSSSFAELYHVSESRISAEISAKILEATAYMGLVLLAMIFLVWFHVQYLKKGLIIGLLAGFNGVSGLLIAWATMGYLGIPRTPVSDIMSQMLLPLGAANVVHTYGYCKQFGKVSYEFFFRAAVTSFVIAMLTTAVGFGASGVSTYPAMQYFGGFGVIGILGCLFTTLFLVFPIMAGMEFDDRSSGIVKIFRRTFGKVVKGPAILSPVQLIVVLTVVSVVVIIGISKTKVDYISSNYLWGSNKVRTEFEVVFNNDSVYVGDVIVKGDPPIEGEEYGSVFEPSTLLALHQFGKKLERDFPGLRAISIYEQLEKLWADWELTKDELPQHHWEIAQQLTFFFSEYEDQELFFVPGYNKKNLVEPSSVRLILYLPYKGSAENRRLKQAVADFEKSLGLPVYFTGRMPRYFDAGDGIVASSDMSTLISAGILTLMFGLFLRRVRLTVAAMIANIVPIALGVASLGLLSISRGISTCITTPIGLCIVVDDTVHFLVQYRDLRNQGIEPNEAVRRTLKNRWEQIFVTSVVIVVGFIPMAFAPLVSFAEFDLLIAIMIGFALFGDLVLLPSLLVTFEEMRFSMSPAKKAKEALEKISSVPHPQP